MRSSPRKMKEEVGVGGRCEEALPAGVESLPQLARLPTVELRGAGEAHGVRNFGLLSRADLVDRLARHFQVSHGMEVEADQGQVVIGDTIDRLRNRIKGRRDEKEEVIVKGEEEGGVEDLVMEAEEEQVVPLQQEVEGQYLLGQRGEGVAEAYTIHTHQQFTEQEVSYEGEDGEQEEEEEEDEEEEEESPSLANIRYKISGESDGGQEMVVQVLPKAVSRSHRKPDKVNYSHPDGFSHSI